MLVLSPRMGKLTQRIGPRIPMTSVRLVVAGGVFLLVRADPGHSYASGVLPGVVVFGLGLAITVGPLTGTVLAAVDQRHVGAASGVNNAASRVAGLVTVAVLPEVTHMGASLTRTSVSAGYHGAMVISAVIAAVGGAIAFVTIRSAVDVTPTALPALHTLPRPRAGPTPPTQGRPDRSVAPRQEDDPARRGSPRGRRGARRSGRAG